MFLRSRSSPEADKSFDEKDLLKIWKGLHYCMWHSDKLLIQQELAGTLADLIFCIDKDSSVILFFKSFLLTICREWTGIDVHRLNKFMTLIRRMWRSVLLFLKRRDWDTELVSMVLFELRQTVLHPNSSTPNGLTFHFIDIYIDELTKVGGIMEKNSNPVVEKRLTEDRVFDFLRPMVVFSLKEKNTTLLHAVIRDVFETLVSQVEDDFQDDLGKEGFEMHGKIDNERLGGPLDKGKGIEDVPGTRLSVDFAALGNYILKLAGGKKIHSQNRKALYKVATKFENLSKGIYPWEEYEVEENEGKKCDGGMKKSEINAAVQRIRQDALQNEGGPQKKKKKRKHKDLEEINDAEEDDDDADSTRKEPIAKKPLQKRPKKKTATNKNKINSNSGEWTVKEG